MFAARPTAPLDAVMGIGVDVRRGLLWATTKALPVMAGYTEADSGRATVWAFDLRSGAVRGRAILPADGPHWLGDLIVLSDGTVYATDSESPAVYRVMLSARGITIEPLVQSSMFRSLQGLAVDETGRTLFLADYSLGLFSVDLRTKRVRALPVPPGVTTLGVDGMAWWNGGLVGIQNGFTPARVAYFRLDSARTRVVAAHVLDRHLPLATEPTLGTVLGGRFDYVANSQWHLYDEKGVRTSAEPLVPPAVLELVLPTSSPD